VNNSISTLNSVVVLACHIWGARPHGERGRHEPIRGPGGKAPSGVQGQSPWSGGLPPWSWSTFGFRTFNGSHKFAHFSKIWKRT